ncbi:tetratricopeptide repeat protein [Psychroflexus maritimus]|uniref:Tetratricopeptide repeat protein n=1 Tax=Psychroflexus maritimus TaxID=2714865 RepID=A0A967ADX1_9FLAO|nr:tetratricopeptide repeat protein [Psychroflexus maritimus]NGZ90482.1 tetratricopeptide repeat protein [Psychroflexus maritimus]
MKKNLVYLIIICLSFQFSFALNTKFEEGNNAYADGNYREATRLYKQIIEDGKVSAKLFYNLANAYYKQQKIAESIYYYELALMLSPTNKSIQNNLKFAENKRIDEIEVAEASAFEVQKENIIFALDQDQWALLAIAGSVFTLLFFMLFLFGKKSSLKRISLSFSGLFLVLAIGVFWLANQQLKTIESKRFGIVFTEEIEILNEPNPRSKKEFTLHEGTKVKIEEEFRNYTKIRIANDNTGWIDSAHVKELKL